MYYSTISVGDATLTFYIHSNCEEMNPRRKRPFVLVCPGGGYAYCSEREAEPIALTFCGYGFNTAVLRYTCNKDKDINRPVYPKPQQELASAIAYIRRNSSMLNTDPSMISVLGFSAGGHLVASMGCLWKEYGSDSRPDALILCYPVISSGEFAHKGSFDNLCGDNTELRESLSLENRVSSDVPPTYIWHTKADATVPVQNTLMFVRQLEKYGIRHEMHLFETGRHGLSLATDEVSTRNERTVNDEVRIWPELVRNWLFEIFGSAWYNR